MKKCVAGSVKVSISVVFCMSVCSLAIIKKALQPCQSCGYSPASGRGRRPQILHYGLIHHHWDSLALLPGPHSSPPCTLTSILTAAQVNRSKPHPHIPPISLCTFLLFFPNQTLPFHHACLITSSFLLTFV